MTPLRKYLELLYDLEELQHTPSRSANAVKHRMVALYGELDEGERAAADKMHMTLGIPLFTRAK